jgi:hypothetical protein
MAVTAGGQVSERRPVRWEAVAFVRSAGLYGLPADIPQATTDRDRRSIAVRPLF